MSTINATYQGDTSFDDLYEPVPSKSEWGMDVLTRVMAGPQPGLATFMAGLSQGATYSFNSQTYYLQSWTCDNDLVFPKVTMVYKGLFAGIPSEFVSGKMISQSMTVTCSSPSKASRTFNYYSRESTYRYIANSRPTGASHSALDVSISPIIWYSIIRNEDGTVYAGNAPSGLVTALTPSTYNQALMECTPVFGTIYFECTDTVTELYTPMDS